jgi:dienelactone hydrolase
VTTTHPIEAPAKPRRGRRKRLGRVALVLLALLFVAVGVLWARKPWVPDIVLAEPGPTGERIVEPGIFGNFYPAKGNGRRPAVLLVGGSAGGIDTGVRAQAVDLQDAGFNVLALSYFGAPGQPKQLELVPLETFDRGLAWLSKRPEVDADRVAVAGQSKGAEVALLTGVRHPELKAVVASAPTSAVWPGISWTGFKANSSWTSDGRPLPAVPYDGVALFGDLGRMYRGALKDFADHPDAMIRVERIRGPVLLVCGEEDDLWPACTMARQVKARAARENSPPVRILAYAGAGHGVFGPPVPRSDERYARLGRWGGTPELMNRVRADAWPKVIAFLRTALR